MTWKIAFFLIIFFIILIFLPIFFLLYDQYLSLAALTKANIVVDAGKTTNPVPDRWKALAQGGEEKGVRMLENVIPQVSAIYPKYIRIDHIYDYYDVVDKDAQGNLIFNWAKLDDTVCDIFHTGAKPFFVLGYMPQALSKDGSMVSAPNNWGDWSLTVQKTIERYSGVNTRLCGQVAGLWFSDIYYEVWNEPDLATFGAWNVSSGDKSYQTLYFYSSLGALKAKDVNHFYLGGPAISGLYETWIEKFLDGIATSGVKIDFISWHHYSPKTSDYSNQTISLNSWLSREKYSKYYSLPRILSEWGYDSEANPLSDTNVGAAYTIASIRNFFELNIDKAFLFEIKDGATPRWGILANDGSEKIRYKALILLNKLNGDELFVDGEGTYITGLASKSSDKITLILVNYDPQNQYSQAVPVKFTNLPSGSYSLTTTYLDREPFTSAGISVQGKQLEKNVTMPANTVVALELVRKQP